MDLSTPEFKTWQANECRFKDHPVGVETCALKNFIQFDI